MPPSGLPSCGNPARAVNKLIPAKGSAGAWFWAGGKMFALFLLPTPEFLRDRKSIIVVPCVRSASAIAQAPLASDPRFDVRGIPGFACRTHQWAGTCVVSACYFVPGPGAAYHAFSVLPKSAGCADRRTEVVFVQTLFPACSRFAHIYMSY